MKRPRAAGAPVDSVRMRAWLDEFGDYRQKVSELSVQDWLRQFEDRDRDVAARLLDIIEYYGMDRIGSLYRRALGLIPGWSAKASKREGRWFFAPLSISAGESGDGMLWQFRLANNLSGRSQNKMFVSPSELVMQRLGAEDTVVLVDDFVGTGDQVCDAWRDSFGELVGGAGRVYLIVSAGTSQARRRIVQETNLAVVAGHELVAKDNVFAPSCTRFGAKEKDVLLAYGMKADDRRPKGYGDCGLVVVFQHRCPNNSLPILHADCAQWTGLFPRDD